MMHNRARTNVHDHRHAATDGERASKRFSRLFDRRFGTFSVRLLPGDCYTTGAADEMIVTVLGSCVAACIRNPYTGYGGMNHFMLPESNSGEWNGVSAALRYGNHAMEALINEVLKSGCSRQQLEIKLFGGSNLTIGPTMVGRKNANFVLRYLETEGLRVAAKDFGGPVGRRIHYFPASGKVQRVFLKHTSDRTLVEEEKNYEFNIEQAPVEGEIDLFG
jgi:chemotaxis protein CheD